MIPELILDVHTDSPVPPYEQIRSQIETMAASGVLPEGFRLPSIRQLAGDLGLAPGTVARAYRELESAGVVVTRVGRGTTVASGEQLTEPERRALLRRAARAYVLAVQHLGAGDEQALAMVRELLA